MVFYLPMMMCVRACIYLSLCPCIGVLLLTMYVVDRHTTDSYVHTICSYIHIHTCSVGEVFTLVG
jgi:3-deoxy-D-manno-octulosonic-acid transferase